MPLHCNHLVTSGEILGKTIAIGCMETLKVRESHPEGLGVTLRYTALQPVTKILGNSEAG